MAREPVAGNMKASFAEKSGALQKCDLLNIRLASDGGDCGAEFISLDIKVLSKLFASATCSKCGTAPLTLLKCKEKQYGLVVKRLL